MGSSVKPITVKDLIAFLDEQPQDAMVAYSLYSEQCLLKLEEIDLSRHCYPRPDGWIQDWRDDKHDQTYLIFPGN